MESKKNKENQFDTKVPPHFHSGISKDQLMFKTFFMMSIIAVASIIVMGEKALFHILSALGTGLAVHFAIYFFQKNKNIAVTYDTPSSIMVASLIVGLSMPIGGPYYSTAVVTLVTIFIFKYGQGKYLKRKYLNPAASAKVLVLVFISILIFLEDSLREGMIFHPHHLREEFISSEGFNASMWIFSNKEAFGYEISAAQSLFFWQTHGWIGGASGLIVLIIGSIAAYWLRFKWRIILGGITTMTLLSIGIGLFTNTGDIPLRIAYHVFTGSFIFMIFFMATEPQSTPMPEMSQYIFGILLSVISFILQLYGIVGGSIIALLILNISTPYLDKIFIKKAYGFKESEGGK